MRASLFVGLIASLALSSRSLAAPRLDQAGVHPGEAFTYVFAVGPIEGARARMSVGMPVHKDGHTRVAIQGQAETVSIVKVVAPVNASYQLVLDTDTLLPSDVISAETGLKNRTFHARLAGRALDLEVVMPQRTVKQQRVLPREARDPLSAYFALRAHALADGDHLELDVLDGAVVWRTRLVVAAHEPITLDEEGPHRRSATAVRLEGTLTRIDDQARPVAKIAPRNLVCWLSDDATHVLLRASFDTELGRARLELTSYAPGRRKPSTPPPLPGVLYERSAESEGPTKTLPKVAARIRLPPSRSLPLLTCAVFPCG